MQVKAADAAYASISPSPVIIFESRTKNLRYANSLAPDIRHGNIDLEVRMKGGSAFIEFKRYMNFGSVRRDVARLANLLEAVRATGETAVGIMVGPSYGRQESGWSTEKFTRSYRDKFVAGAPNLDTYLYVSKPYRLSEPVAYGKNEVEQFQAIAVLMSEP